jgi:hypothetical protein
MPPAVEHAETDAPIPNDREKLRWEIEELRAETENLRKLGVSDQSSSRCEGCSQS